MSEEIMKVIARVEYACGHEGRTLAEGEVDKNNVHADLARIVSAATGKDNLVNAKCHCGRGATFLELLVDGKIVARTPASAFIGKAIVVKRKPGR